MVVYGSSYGVFGHIATVVAVEPGRYEVIDQNFLDVNPHLESHWQTFDLRSIAWPDPVVVGFVVAPVKPFSPRKIGMWHGQSCLSARWSARMGGLW